MTLTGQAMSHAILGSTVVFLCAAGFAAAQEVIRHPIPHSTYPIARAVEIPGNLTVVHLSGMGPAVIDTDVDADAPEAYGDTLRQTLSALDSIAATLTDLGLEMSDVYKMQVFLVPPKGAREVDVEGFLQGYRQVFGHAGPIVSPAGAVLEVSGLAHPAWLVEIEVTAARPKD